MRSERIDSPRGRLPIRALLAVILAGCFGREIREWPSGRRILEGTRGDVAYRCGVKPNCENSPIGGLLGASPEDCIDYSACRRADGLPDDLPPTGASGGSPVRYGRFPAEVEYGHCVSSTERVVERCRLKPACRENPDNQPELSLSPEQIEACIEPDSCRVIRTEPR